MPGPWRQVMEGSRKHERCKQELEPTPKLYANTASRMTRRKSNNRHAQWTHAFYHFGTHE